MHSSLERIVDDLEQSEIKKSFNKLDHKSITKMTDAELSSWHSEYDDGSPQGIFANHEWNRRLLSEQLKSARFSTWAVIIASLAGVALGALLKG